ncbi:MAG: hypothetical protein U0324_03515 [Polyangiales bacterium]
MSHAGVALLRAQTLLHRPQWSVLVRVSMHAPPVQRSKPGGHAGWVEPSPSSVGASAASRTVASRVAVWYSKG